MKRIIITESQLNYLVESELLMESIFEAESVYEFKQEVKKLIKRMLIAGMSIAAIYTMINNYCERNNIPEQAKQEALNIVKNTSDNNINNKTEDTIQVAQEPKIEKRNNNGINLNDWELADTKTIATVYNAIPAQCNGDFGHTASMFRLNLENVLSQRVIAMERTFMKKLNLKYGDVVYITGTGKWDGVWQIQDTMNKRFAGQHKIDILVPNDIKLGSWENVNLYVLKDKSLTDSYKSQMAPQVSKEESKRQVAAMKAKFKQNRK
jgi:hypothetical protein